MPQDLLHHLIVSFNGLKTEVNIFSYNDPLIRRSGVLRHIHDSQSA